MRWAVDVTRQNAWHLILEGQQRQSIVLGYHDSFFVAAAHRWCLKRIARDQNRLNVAGSGPPALRAQFGP